MSGRPSTPAARLALVGLHGHGRWHLGNIRRLDREGLVELVGVGDPRSPTPALMASIGDAPWFPDVDRLLASTKPDVTILCTPIHTHVDLALEVAAAGSHLLLEKPPAPSLAEFGRLSDGLAGAGARCQVGFQSLGSGAVAGLRALIEDGTLGELHGIGAAGLSVRDARYFSRGGWAGKRRLQGVDVVDGALTNPYIHAIAAALRLANAEAPGSIVATELELHRANEIESDDTSVARLSTSSGLPIVVAATLCAPVAAEPVLFVHGSRGRATWWYKHDVVRLDAEGHSRELHFSRTDLLADLVGHLNGVADSLIVPLASTHAVTEFVDTVRQAPTPVAIAPEQRVSAGTGAEQRWIVDRVDTAVTRAAEELSVFSEQGVPWAAPAAGERSTTLDVGEREVGRYEIAPCLDRTLAPRPFLHPVRTLGGTTVTDREPVDHRWHLGVGVAIQDVGGVNFWGGRTFIDGEGYVWRDDHGTIRHLGWTQRTSMALAHELAWMSPTNRCLLVERRSISTAGFEDKADRWLLEFRFALHNVSGRTLSLGSPGSNGRPGGGYGGFFWRLPGSTARRHVRTDRATGEQAVHGSVSPWLSWEDEGEGDSEGFTIVIAPGDPATSSDPWFVRSTDYPGVGSALAWDRPLTLDPDEVASRCLRALVVDGAGHVPADLYEYVCRPTRTGGLP